MKMSSLNFFTKKRIVVKYKSYAYSDLVDILNKGNYNLYCYKKIFF